MHGPTTCTAWDRRAQYLLGEFQGFACQGTSQSHGSFFFHFLGLNGINLSESICSNDGGSFRENCFRIAMERKTQTSCDHVSLKIPPAGFGDVNSAWSILFVIYFKFIWIFKEIERETILFIYEANSVMLPGSSPYWSDADEANARNPSGANYIERTARRVYIQ